MTTVAEAPLSGCGKFGKKAAKSLRFQTVMDTIGYDLMCTQSKLLKAFS
jgi:hypothetical protein